MHSAPEIKGWCPGALSPMQSDDGLLMRPKVVGSRLTLAQAREIAAIAGECGNGLLDLSQRAQLQMRGLGEATREEAQARLKTIGLLAPDAATESVLNVIASPLTGGAFDANEIAARLANAIVEDRTLQQLPGKFLFLVDDGGAPGLAEVAADIRLEALGGDIAVVIDGARDLAFVATPDVAIDAALDLARAFIRLREGRAFELRRMRALVDALGVQPPLGEAALSAVPYHSACRTASMADLLGARQAGEGFFAGIATPFGRWLASDFSRVIEAAAQEGGSELRLTPWRAVLALAPSNNAATRIARAAASLGLIVDAEDARLAITACPGAPECPQAKGATRDRLERLAPIARQLAPQGIGLHVSGCAKGCAKPSPAPATLIVNGEGFDLVHDGRASDAPSLSGLSLADVERILAERARKEASCPAA